jgi:hypothetical protein
MKPRASVLASPGGNLYFKVIQVAGQVNGDYRILLCTLKVAERGVRRLLGHFQFLR